jgi:hypothetical protein
MTASEIEALAEDALNAACLEIQKKLGVTDGGVAGVFFSGDEGDDVRAHFNYYIRLELNWMGSPVNPPADE